MYVGRYEHALTWKVSICIQEKRFDHQKCFYQKQHEPMMMKHQNTHKLTTVWTPIPTISLIKPQKLDNEQKLSHPFFQISDVITMIWNYLHIFRFISTEGWEERKSAMTLTYVFTYVLIYVVLVKYLIIITYIHSWYGSLRISRWRCREPTACTAEYQSGLAMPM